jgi:hypothetical protein
VGRRDIEAGQQEEEVSLADPIDDYIDFDEIGDVLASVDVIAVLAPTLSDNPLRWKWVILAAHSAMQGAMVCAYADSANTSILKKQSEAERLEWLGADEDTRGPYPGEWLADFKDLLRKCLRGSHDCAPLVLTKAQRKDIDRLHQFRNGFTHFTPKGWAIEQVGLPRIIGVALDIVEELINRDQVILNRSGFAGGSNS